MSKSFWLIAVPADKNERAEKNEKQAKEALGKKLTNIAAFNTFKIYTTKPLKVGTLDQLMQLSDDLGKTDTQVEAVCKKVERSFYDLLKNKPPEKGAGGGGGAKEGGGGPKGGERKEPASELKITVSKTNNKTGEVVEVQVVPSEFISNFHWDRNYSKSEPIRNLVDDMVKEVVKADEELKGQLATYNETRGVLENMERRENGNLLVKPLSSYLKPSQMLDREHITTLLVVVPKARHKYFLDNYEFLEAQDEKKQEEVGRAMQKRGAAMAESKPGAEAAEEEKHAEEPAGEQKAKEKEGKEAAKENPKEREAREKAQEEERRHQARMARLPKCANVVPRSAQVVTEDAEYVLFSMLIFKKGAEHFKNLCRQERFTVRPFKFDPEEEKSLKDKKAQLEEKRKSQWNVLVRWCRVWFSKLFSLWMHVKAMRVFVEAVLRYGLPVSFQSFALEVKKGNEKKVRKALDELYGHLTNPKLMGHDDAGGGDLGGMAVGEFFPYVSMTVNLDSD